MGKIKIFSILAFLSCFVFFAFNTNSAYAISPDLSFSSDGKLVTAFGGHAEAFSVGTQVDGKYIVAGYQVNTSNNRDWAVVRYETDGSIDSSFGDGGTYLNDFGGLESSHGDFLQSVVIQADGRIVVGGSSAINSSTVRWTIARFDVNGNLDTSFGSGGIINTTVRNGFSIEYINDLVLQPDGKIIAVGVSHVGSTDIALVRYDPDGSLDTTFGGGDGIVTTSITPSNDRGNAVVLQPDGKIVVSGDFNAGGHDEVFIARYEPDGDLDTTFGGGDGIVTANFGGYNGSRDIALQSDGKIVIAGPVFQSGANNTYVARFNSNGTLDNTFNGTGKNIIAFSSGNDYATSLILQPDGKIVIGGESNVGSPAGDDFMLARFNEDGSLDTTFDTDGVLTAPIGSGNDGIKSISLQSDGKLVAVGYAHNGSHNDWAIARFTDLGLGVELGVPLFKQTSFPWGDDEYDQASAWTAGDTDMSAWGCAVTSAAMVFDYHGLEEISSGVDLDPGTLNEWLKSQLDGYVRNGLTNWLALSRLSNQITGLNGVDFNALEYERILSSNHQAVKDAIDLDISDILREPGHFVVSRGYTDSDIKINDPFFERDDLSEYESTFQNISRYTPSSTDLSYIMLAVNVDVDVIILDENNNEIETIIVIDEPISDPSGSNETNAQPLKIVYFPKPESGVYKIEVNGTEYLLDVYLYDKDGKVNKFSFESELGDGDTTYNLAFDKQEAENSNAVEDVTFDSLLKDLTALYENGEIKKFGTYVSLSARIKAAQYVWSKKTSKAILNNTKKAVEQLAGLGHLTSDAKDYLLERIEVLINN